MSREEIYRCDNCERVVAEFDRFHASVHVGAYLSGGVVLLTSQQHFSASVDFCSWPCMSEWAKHQTWTKPDPAEMTL